MNNSFNIKQEEHFKLYVLLKDKFLFESELEKSRIKFYVDINEQPFIDGGIRYFFLIKDMNKINEIVLKNEIVVTTESNLVSDFSDQKKTVRLIFCFIISIIAVLILIAIFEKMIT